MVHPNDAGYEKIADAFYAGIRTALDSGWVTEPAPVDEQPEQCTARQGYEGKGRIWEGLPGNPDAARSMKYADLDGVPRAWFNTGGSQWTERGQIATGTGGVVALPELDGDGRADWVGIARNGALDAWLNKDGD